MWMQSQYKGMLLHSQFQLSLRLCGSQFSCKSWVKILALAADGAQGEKEDSAQSLTWHCWLQTCSVLQDKDQKPQRPEDSGLHIINLQNNSLWSLSAFTCWKNLGSNECCRDEHSRVCTGLRADWSMLKNYLTIEIHEGIFLNYFKICNWHKTLQSLGLQ